MNAGRDQVIDAGDADVDAAQVGDPYDVRLALGATGLLRTFNQERVIDAADVHVASRLADLAGEPDDRVRLAVALAVRGVRQGSVCIELGEASRLAPEQDWPEPDDWVDAVRASSLVGAGRPLRADGSRLYLERYWRQETQVADDLVARAANSLPEVDHARLEIALDRLFPRVDDQRDAARSVVTGWTTVIGGGPGTGKTTTIARVLALLVDQPGPVPRIALAAPTGKAAARLSEAVSEASAELTAADQLRLPVLSASTIHRLLGGRPGRTRFRHDRQNRLPYDVIVIDETSMVSLTLMARLLEAVRPEARLVLVGDPDQLASVEAGVVLADIAAGLAQREAVDHAAASGGGATASAQRRSSVVTLRRVWRFGGGVAELASAVRAGDPAQAAAVLARAGDVTLVAPDTLDRTVHDEVVGTATAIRTAAEQGDAAAALAALGRHRLLCAHRHGPYGVGTWSREIERWLADLRPEDSYAEWYVGRPLLVTANDHALGLSNGDTGVVIRLPDGGVRAAFPRAGSFVTYAPSRLADVQTVHAMTVHRSQGSQFERVTLVLPPVGSPLLTRELLYTAITRAQHAVRVIGTEAAVAAAISTPAVRASGLRERLARLP